MVDRCLPGLYVRKELAEHEEEKNEAESTKSQSLQKGGWKAVPLDAGNVGDDSGPAPCYGSVGVCCSS